MRYLLLLGIFLCVDVFSREPSKALIFEYKSEIQEHRVSSNGPVFVRVWGAGGGSTTEYAGGAGGYASGYLDLPVGSILKIVVGKGGWEKSGEPSAIYLNQIAPENALIVAGGGSSANNRGPGRGGGQTSSSPSLSDSRYVLDRLFLPGENGEKNQAAKPRYDCTRDYKIGVATGNLKGRGGDGLVAISRGSQDFCYTGTLQTFTVPGGVTSITVDAWGGGGGGSRGYSRMFGAGAGYATRAVDVAAGEKYDVVIGGGGQRAFASQSAAYGGGGLGYFHTPYFSIDPGSGGGGGRSQVSFPIIVAGGGGGAGGGYTDGGDTGHPVTGVGGGASGGDGGDAAGGSGAGGGGGTGGTQTAGGSGGTLIDTAPTYPGEDGSRNQGGYGDYGNARPGGGGGAGYYGGGGGGGGFSGVDSGGGGGGGGSSFPSTGSISGSGQAPGNASDDYLPIGAGRGGDINSDGGDGFAYITW